MTQLRRPFVQTRRDAWIEINLANIEHNIKKLKNFISPKRSGSDESPLREQGRLKLIPKTKFLAVVKADAYGHGATMAAPTLLASGVDMLGVASADEGLQLREAGIDAPILVLGAIPDWAFTSAVENDLQLSIFTYEHIQACINIYNKLKKKPKVHIKVDTGMHRIGIPYENANKFIDEVLKTDAIKLEGVFSHLACAENADATEKQKLAWESVVKNIKNSDITLHLANTAGLTAYKDLQYDMVRSGIGIYGMLPDFPENVKSRPQLKQAMGLRGRIVHIQDLPKNSGISYGHSYITGNDSTKIATIPIGYADGVPRALSNNIYGLINGEKVAQVGNITMDQMMFDISNVANAHVGDIITLLGYDENSFVSIDSWAKKLNTINYEITCRLKVRLPRIYTRNQF